MEIKNFGGAGDADDKIRLDLTAFDDDFTLIINGESPGDQLILTGVDSVVYNADFTQTVTYTGSDGQTHVVTISDDIPFDQVTHYGTDDDIVDGTSADEVISDGYTDYAGDEVQDTADNVIFGHGGADTITGGTGADTIFGDFDKPAGTLTEDFSQPDPSAEQLTFSITDAEIDGNGDVELNVEDIAVDVDGEEDIVFTDDGTEAITSIHIAKMGKGDDEQDVFRFDLSTFDDDFTITVWSEGTEDHFVFSNAQNIVDNGDGTSTITYIGSDDQTHYITIDTGLAQLEFYTSDVSEEYDDVIDAGAGDDSVDGGYGQDSIDGGDGADTLIGNIGADTINGGAGDDVIHGDFPEALEPLPTRDPLPWAEELTSNIGDADIDVDGVVGIQVDQLTPNENMSQDVVINDVGTEAITEVTVSGLGGGQVDVIRLDLAGFDDDFDFIAENVGSEDVVVFTGVDSVVDNGDGTQTLSYTGSDGQPHTVVVDTNNAQLDITYATVDETEFADDNDLIDGGSGDDTIDGGYGDDTIIASSDNDSIVGGDGNDTYDATGSTTLTDEAFSVTVDGVGDASVVKTVDGSTDALTGIEAIIADEGGGDDTISFSADVEANQILGLDGDEVGVFTPDNGDPIAFGGPGEPSLADILSGTYTPPGAPYPVHPNGDYQVFGDDLEFQVDETTFDNFEQVNFGINDPMVVCFVRGTRILTRDGERAVEDLAISDQVLTLDNGYQPIKWIGRSKAIAKDKLAPVLIEKGAMGSTRDLFVSQQHRILMSGWKAEMLFGDPEVLVPAKALVNGQDVHLLRGGLVEYYHILFERHEIIYSEGILSESFHPADQGISAISHTARNELFGLFPELASDAKSYGETARPCLRVREGQLLRDELASFAGRFFLAAKPQKAARPDINTQTEASRRNRKVPCRLIGNEI